MTEIKGRARENGTALSTLKGKIPYLLISWAIKYYFFLKYSDSIGEQSITVHLWSVSYSDTASMIQNMYVHNICLANWSMCMKWRVILLCIHSFSRTTYCTLHFLNLWMIEEACGWQNNNWFPMISTSLALESVNMLT